MSTRLPQTAEHYESAVTAIAMGEYAMRIPRPWDCSSVCLEREKLVVGLNRVDGHAIRTRFLLFHLTNLGSIPVDDVTELGSRTQRSGSKHLVIWWEGESKTGYFGYRQDGL